MGLNLATGAFASLTNVRSKAPRPSGGRSRGELVTAAIGASAPVDIESEEYTAFNLWHGRLMSDGRIDLKFSRSWPGASPSGWQAASSRVPQECVIAHSNEPSGDQWDDSWPKTRWLRAEVSRVMKSLPRSGASAEELRDLLAKIMTTTNDVSVGDMPDLGFSPHEVWRETILQHGPFVSHAAAHDAAVEHGLADWAYGTMCQSIIIASHVGRKVYYYYRSTKNAAQIPGAWQTFEAPWPADAADVDLRPALEGSSVRGLKRRRSCERW
eukprot:gnl/MRDRNA2_/MRDRNA2_115951_c0_seq1.p1 gnl/MRDRNA2_/MRDRNA2_115951_c0~~gnl/MRDRNA2_/MRDRNA2_115951_c0_seq1.p1  ORF type:complete len:269 (-),score=33.11 gnl/MRDRNA2_/MRDRNA2_115951_c0_seq1:223-1029(-)